MENKWEGNRVTLGERKLDCTLTKLYGGSYKHVTALGIHANSESSGQAVYTYADPEIFFRRGVRLSQVFFS